MNRAGFLAATASLALAVPRRAFAADEIASRCQAYLDALAALGRFNGAALVHIGDRIVFRGASGRADLARGTACTPATQFDVASISKMFTAFATLVLRDRGALRLDDPLERYVNDCPPAWRTVTIAQLMHHTSGIPDYEDALDIDSDAYLAFMREPNSSQRILMRERPLPLDFPPGSKFNYSNTGYVVLGTIVQQVGGMPFGAFLRREIFDRAEMQDTGTFGYDAPARLAVGYKSRDVSWPTVVGGFNLAAYAVPLPQLPLTPPHGDAGVFSTVGDLTRWNAVMQGRGFVPPARIAEIMDAGAFGYADGWMIGTPDGRKRYRHTGELPGFLGVTQIFPDDRLSIVLLSNWMRSRLSVIAPVLGAIALGSPYDMPVSGTVVTLSDEQRAPLTGTYRSERNEIMTVKLDPLGLEAAIPGRFTIGLIPLGSTRFYAPFFDGTATFTTSADGKAVSVNLHYGGVDHVAARTAGAPGSGS